MASTTDDTTLLWLRPEPSGRKPRYTRAEIVRTAIGLADREGFEAVTMKRIAAELGAGTMTLYYYVRNKADIVALMQDAIFSDVLVPAGQLPGDWREAVTVIARRSRDALVGHPWSVSSLNQAQFGPNAMAHYEQSLAALAATTLDYPQKAEVTAILDDYVVGSATHTIEVQERLRAAAGNTTLLAEAKAYGDALMSTGAFPELAALTEHATDTAGPEGGIGPLAHLDRQFETGLAALLDGIGRHYAIG
ncbi:MAG TPA: TetR/AcrR family transcriptional regulator [Trebonia sp.]|nr:TetR/AcrR family transcriptional regulator [Trebonia sp.]